MKALRTAGVVLLTLIFLHVLQQYFFVTRYSFNPSEPFAGDSIYNPYQSIAGNEWLKCNFHAHAKAWKGITNGKGTAEDIHRVYDSAGYDVHCVSNYHQIDVSARSAGIYIPSYEHGYNIRKTHQLVLGSDNVCWNDYLLPQLTSNKQDILNRLYSDTNAVVVLNHPVVRNGYTREDLLRLTNYHCMEVLSPAGQSFGEWDEALSAGKPVFIVGNDDTHDILSGNRFGRMCTFVSVAARTRKEVLRALKEGRSYGVAIGPQQDPFSIPRLNMLQLSGNTIWLEVDQLPEKIEFIGQDGRLLAEFHNTPSAEYALKEEDRYARANIFYPNGTSLHLNPVFYSGKEPLSQAAVFPDHLSTFLFRLAGALLLAIWLRWVIIILFGRKADTFPTFAKRLQPGRA